VSTKYKRELSIRNTPELWHVAQEESPVKADSSPLSKTRKVRLIPKGDRVSVFAASIAALLGGLVGGIAWYLGARWGFIESPWIAIALGIFIPVVVRVASGSGDAPIRAGASFALYVVTLLAVLSLLTRSDLVTLYGAQLGGFDVFEARFKTRYFNEAQQFIAYGLGAVASIQVSYLFKEKGSL